ncbi:MAG: T9SS type A sorting domain-containing protein [Flavobacteriales bacterium]|nr:T9SS type A sorting domain-containing protein [Flavobacteriales bacterium]
MRKQLHRAFKPLFLVCIFFHVFAWRSVAQSPTISSYSPAAGAVGTLVSITGSNLGNPTAFTIGGVPAVTVSNTGNTLVGMVMPGAVEGAVTITTAGGTAAGGSDFVVVPTSYPNAQLGSKVVGSGAANAASQGLASAISADGTTAVFGGHQDNGGVGAVWVFTRAGETWVQQGGKLIGTGGGSAFQGWSVALSADGNTAIVGGDRQDVGVGAAWVFTRTNGVWSQQGPRLVGSGAVGASHQGISVSISADGNTAIVGGPGDGNLAGAAWVFTRTNGTWTQQGPKLVGTGAIGNAWQGQAVALSADGNTAAVGGHYDNNQKGAVWIYTRTGTTWTQQGNKRVGTGAVGGLEQQGVSVALSADGNTALVGGIWDNGGKGAVWVHTRTAGVWSQQGTKIVGTGSVGAIVLQGSAVALTADGNTAMVGAKEDNTTEGAAWVFTRTGGTWSQQGTKRVGTGDVGGAWQGNSVSLSATGTAAIMGGYRDDDFVGACWMFTGEDQVGVQGATTTPFLAYVDGGEMVIRVPDQVDMRIDQVSMFDPSGKTLFSRRPITVPGGMYRFDLPALASGMYVIVLRTADRTYSTKVMVQ